MADSSAATQIVATAQRLNLTAFKDHAWAVDVDYYAGKAEQAAAVNRMKASAGTVSFASLLESEVYKALGQANRRRLRGALISVAALAMHRAVQIDLELEGEPDYREVTTLEAVLKMDPK